MRPIRIMGLLALLAYFLVVRSTSYIYAAPPSLSSSSFPSSSETVLNLFDLTTTDKICTGGGWTAHWDDAAHQVKLYGTATGSVDKYCDRDFPVNPAISLSPGTDLWVHISKNDYSGGSNHDIEWWLRARASGTCGGDPWSNHYEDNWDAEPTYWPPSKYLVGNGWYRFPMATGCSPDDGTPLLTSVGFGIRFWNDPNEVVDVVIDHVVVAKPTDIRPTAPSDLTAIADGQIEIDLTWVDQSTDETHFSIERSTDGGNTWSEIGTTTLNNASDLGLTCNTTYHYRVRAYRASDLRYSAYSNVASVTTKGCASPPTPSDLSAVSAGQNQINLTWNDNSTDETDFRVERSENGVDGWAQIAITTFTSVSDNTGLVCGKSYHYRVRAYRDGDGQYSAYSNVESAMTGACPAPPSVDAGLDMSATEGIHIIFSGSFTDTAAGTHSIRWDFGDGESATGTLNPTHYYSDNGAYVVTLEVTNDATGLIGSDSLVITVNNATPSVTLQAISPTSLLAGDSFTGNVQIFDLGSDSWYALIDYGDTTPPESFTTTESSFSFVHTFEEPGIYSIAVCIMDDDEGLDCAVLIVTVQSLQEKEAVQTIKNQVTYYLASGDLTGKQANSLLPKLDAAIFMLDQGNSNVAINQLHAFINQVNAFMNNSKFSDTVGQTLIDAANQAINQLSD